MTRNGRRGGDWKRLRNILVNGMFAVLSFQGHVKRRYGCRDIHTRNRTLINDTQLVLAVSQQRKVSTYKRRTSRRPQPATFGKCSTVGGFGVGDGRRFCLCRPHSTACADHRRNEFRSYHPLSDPGS